MRTQRNSRGNPGPDTKKAETLEDFARGVERALMASGVSLEKLVSRLLGPGGKARLRKAGYSGRTRKNDREHYA